MLSLDDIGVAAPAMQIDSPPVLGEMRLVIENDIPLRDTYLRFDQPLLVAARLETIGIGHVCNRPGIIRAYRIAQLTRERVERTVFVAFEARHHPVRGSLPFVVKRKNEMARFAYGWFRDHDLFHKDIGGEQEKKDNAE